MAAMRPSRTARSATKPGAPLPSTMVPPRMTRSAVMAISLFLDGRQTSPLSTRVETPGGVNPGSETAAMLHERTHSTLLLSEPSPGILQVMLNRPERANAFTSVMGAELIEVFQAWEAD